MSPFFGQVFSPLLLFLNSSSPRSLLRVQDLPGISVNDVSSSSLPSSFSRILHYSKPNLPPVTFILVILSAFIVLGANNENFYYRLNNLTAKIDSLADVW